MSLLLRVPLRSNNPKKFLQEITAGSDNTFAIDKNGNAWGWGANSNVQLGDNTNVPKVTPNRIALYGLNKTFCKIETSGFVTLAIDKNNRLWAWGINGSGQLGDNTAINKCYPVLVKGTTKTFCKIIAGSVSLAIDKNGRLWSWGSGAEGRLGNNSTTNQFTPVSVLGAVKTFCEIDSNTSTVAIDKNGRAWGWGNNSNGAIGDGTTVCKLTPVSVAGAVKTFCKIAAGFSYTVALDKNGRAWAWGNNGGGQLGDNTTICRSTPVSVVGAIKTFCEIKIANGLTSFILALDKYGRAWSWGTNTNSQLGDGTTIARRTPVSVAGQIKTFCKIAVGGDHSIAIDKNGRTWAWGTASTGALGAAIYSKITPVSILGAVKTFCEISGTGSSNSAIDKNGRVWGWGGNTNGTIGDNSTICKSTPVSILGAVKTFCKIAAGNLHVIALDKNGRAWGWGNNTNGTIGDNSIISRLTPVSVAGAIKTFCEISSAFTHSMALDKNGRAWGWGNNTGGRLGDNTTIQRNTPVSVAGAVKTFCQIYSGFSNSAALDKNGRAWGWGTNSGGMIGDGTTISKLTPVSVAGAVKTFCKIATGNNHTVAIDKNGKLWAWGNSGSGQLGNGIILSVFTPVTIRGALKTFCQITAGGLSSLGIDKNGRAWGWGSNGGGQIGDNSVDQRNSPVSVLGAVKTFCKIFSGGTSGSTAFTLALDKNGRAWTWGYNGVGQLGNNATISQRTPVSVAGAVKTFCEISNGPNQAFSLAIDKNGRAWAWGINGNGNLGNNTVISQRTPVSVLGAVKTFCKVAVGGFHSLAIDKNGRLWAWGNNSNGQLGNNTFNNSVLTPVSVLGAVKTFCHIAGGNSQSVAIDKNGQAWGWGFNGSGQNGDGGAYDNYTPVSVQGQKKTFCKIASGNGTSLAIDNYGRLWTWGFNGNAQIGDDSTIAKRTPVRVCGNKTFCHVGATNAHVTAIEKNGQVWAWGNNSNGSLGNPYSLSVVTPVSVIGQANKTFCQIKVGFSDSASFALDKNGKLWSWGLNTVGQLGLGTLVGLIFTPKQIYNKTFCKIGTFTSGATAIDYKGRVWAWGLNNPNQLGRNNFFVLSSTPVRVCVI